MQMFPLSIPEPSDLVLGPAAHSLYVRPASCCLAAEYCESDQDRIVEVAGFFLLQIGLPVLDNDGWTLVSDAAFQSLSVRASGFNILPVSTFAPALL